MECAEYFLPLTSIARLIGQTANLWLRLATLSSDLPTFKTPLVP